MNGNKNCIATELKIKIKISILEKCYLIKYIFNFLSYFRYIDILLFNNN